MNKKMKRIVTSAMGGLLLFTSAPGLAACGGGSTKDAIVIMTEALSGLYNPFYATAGADLSLVGMTQIGMLSTDSDGDIVVGEDQPTVVQDYKVEEKTDETVYTFIIKNGLKFSDGKPLTMNDVMFNLYEYLDPVYAGSSTMYSTKIKGLSEYRTQKKLSDGDSSEEDNADASNRAAARIAELRDIFEDYGLRPGSTTDYYMTKSTLFSLIDENPISMNFKNAVATKKEQESMTDANYRAILKADYEHALEVFKKELESDYNAAQESFDFKSVPYSAWSQYQNNAMFKFLVYEGIIRPVYVKVEGREDKTRIESFDNIEALTSSKYGTKDAAIEAIFKTNVEEKLNIVLTGWGTAGTLTTEYTAAALDVILHDRMDASTEKFENISGIVSLGHTTSETAVVIDETTYAVAQQHNADGTPVSNTEYDVLQITIEGIDPKAIFNFSFTVAPAHYYTADAENPNGRPIDIANNKFGVEYANSEFQSNVIQALHKQEVPVGAGPFKATDRNNVDNPKGENFVNSNIVYFKANDNFMFPVKARKLQMQVVSETNAIAQLEKGAVDYITPQFTKDNFNKLEGLKGQGITSLSAWQLGYGYIGINAGKIPNIYLRRAIMAAMEVKLASQYYVPGTCVPIDWPMSMVSWAYPSQGGMEESMPKTSKPNGKSYTQWDDRAENEQKIRDLVNQAKNTGATEADMKIRFTIAGASITEHPTYAVFNQAAEILNGLNIGFDVEVKADSQALTKLATGSLAVWAAAWGSTLDPDMYQVYHKNSKATSVYAWGYREILKQTSTYPEENKIISKLSEVIDRAREKNDRTERSADYEEAMGYVLELAVEMPVYQRKSLFAYNSKTVKGFNSTVNPYSSPLDRVWELELVK